MIRDLKNGIIIMGAMTFSGLSSSYAAPSATMEQLPQFVLNLGSYFGYDLNNPPAPPPIKMSDEKSAADNQKMAVELYLGTILDTSIVDPNSKSPLASFINQKINAIFKNGVFNTPSSAQQPTTGVSVSKLLDQTPFQSDPVDQTILNALTTPDYSYCSQVPQSTNVIDSNAGTNLASRCWSTPSRAQYRIGINVMGTLPAPTDLFNAVDPSVLTQLNSNTLINPLLYATSQSENPSGASSGLATTTVGLQAANQAQEAENFIRYVTGSVAPSPQTKATTYQTLYNQAIYPSLSSPATQAEIERMTTAQGTLSSYLANLRVFAAQTSVGVGNLYYILSKRMSQTPGSGTATSQALNEYTMATRRLYDPAAKNLQWTDQINSASPAAVQKEIAVLLSEINYQLYLTRQQQERLLLTNTVMLFQLGHLVAPPPIQLSSQ